MKTIEINGIEYELIDQDKDQIDIACGGCIFFNTINCIKKTNGLCVLDENINKIWKLLK